MGHLQEERNGIEHRRRRDLQQRTPNKEEGVEVRQIETVDDDDEEGGAAAPTSASSSSSSDTVQRDGALHYTSTFVTTNYCDDTLSDGDMKRRRRRKR